MSGRGRRRNRSTNRQIADRVAAKASQPTEPFARSRRIREKLRQAVTHLVQQNDLTGNSPTPLILATRTENEPSDWNRWGKHAATYALKVLLTIIVGIFVILQSKQADALLRHLGFPIDTIAIPSTGFPEHPWEANPNSPIGSPPKWERNNGWYHIPSQGFTNPAAIEMEMQNPNGRRDGPP